MKVAFGAGSSMKGTRLLESGTYVLAKQRSRLRKISRSNEQQLFGLSRKFRGSEESELSQKEKIREKQICFIIFHECG